MPNTSDKMPEQYVKYARLLVKLEQTGVNIDWLARKNPTTKQLEDLLIGIQYLQERVTYP